MIPTVEEMKKLAANVAFIDACNKTNCGDCEWSQNRRDCRDLAYDELAKQGAFDGQ